MTKTVLIANRGEIACRIIRACRAEGLQTVAIYAPVEAQALHVAMADRSVAIEAAKPVQSYLAIVAIVEAARACGAHAVHPGYGFLAENAAFAEAVEAAGIAFIGPHAKTIHLMGDKERARELARDAGVPVLSGSERFAPGALDGLAEAAEAVGYPLLVKSCAGGGGIGMRVVEQPAELERTVQATQKQAESAFGDGTVFLERYIPEARHVEVQVFGFGDGQAVHLFERECSIQRRFQKIVEESPAPGIGESVREAMTGAALSLARKAGYRSAGTLEFIVDARTQDFFFLEMNTRIQVEHPVTEMVTGVDLVRLQLRQALGSLCADDLPQATIVQKGHAIELRLCAENPARMFLPSPGTLETLSFPEESASLRIESGFRQGDRVTAHFDSMIAKIIGYGETREAAIASLREACKATKLGSYTSNLPFLQALIDHEAFARGETFTNFLQAHRSELPLG